MAVDVPVVVVDIGGTEIVDGGTIHVDSGATTLQPATSYYYRIEGMVHGTGQLAFPLPNGTLIKDFVDLVSPGASSSLIGTKANPAGTFPVTVVDQTYAGTKVIPALFTITASVPVKGSVSAAGVVSFDVLAPVVLKRDGVATGEKVVFEPGAKLTVGVAPVLAFQSATASVTEDAGTVTLTVARTANLAGAVMVHYATANGTATQPGDYTTTTGTLNFADAQATATITVPIIDDVVSDGNKTFTVTLDTPTAGAVLGTQVVNTVTIADNEPAGAGALAFATATASVNENAGTVTLTVARTVGTAGAVTVHFATANGTATQPGDYTTTTGTLNFADAQATATITVPIIDDVVSDGNKTFTVTLDTPTAGAVLGTQVVNTVTIADNEPAGAGALAFATATASVNENAGTVTLTVARTVGTAGAVTVHYATANGTATQPGDYTTTTGTLNFADAQASATITVPIIDDVLSDGNKTFTVTLDTPGGGAVLGAQVVNTVTIVDNEPAGASTLNLAAATASVNETATSAILTVTRTVSVLAATSVQFATSNGTAHAPADYTTTSGTLNFAAGQASATIPVPIKNNAARGVNKTFTVTISAPTAGAVLGTQKTTLVTIVDDETTPGVGTVAFASATAAVGEKAGSAVLTVARTGSTVGAISVRYATLAGTALAGRDFRPAAGTLTFLDGEASKTVTVGIVDDNLDNAGLNFSVVLSTPLRGAVLGATTTAVVTISDNDAASLTGFAGSYSSALHKVPFALANEGLLTLTLTPAGRFTGALFYGGKRYGLSGGFRLDGSTLAPIVLSRTPALALVLTLASAPQGITAELRSGATSLATVALSLTGFNPANPATRPGKYTVALAPAALAGAQTAATLPRGYGYGTLSLSTLGAVSLVGKLADGTPVSASSFALSGGSASLYAPLYLGKGAVFGDLTFRAAAATDDLDGSLRWIRPLALTGSLYVGGFDTTLAAHGSVFVAPPLNTRVINLPTALLDLTSGNLTALIQKTIAIDTRNLVTVTPQPDVNLVHVTVSRTTGVFSGGFRGTGLIQRS